MTSLEDALTLKLSEERVGRTLPEPLVEVLVKYLIEDCLIKDVTKVKLDDLVSTGRDAWSSIMSSALPGLHDRELVAWVGRVPAKISGDGAFVEKDASEAINEDTTELFGEHGATATELNKLKDDISIQKICGARILGLTLSLQTGRLHGSGDIIGIVRYGCDVRVSETVKRLRKAGLRMMNDILEAKDSPRMALNDHFTDIVRAYSESGKIQEAHLVTNMWTEVQSVCQSDELLRLYLKEWFKKYPGRGIPQPIDLILLVRCMNTVSSNLGVSPEIRELRDLARSLKIEANQAKAEAASIKNQFAQLKATINLGGGLAGGRAGRGGRGGRGVFGAGFERDLANVKCHNCGEMGHYAANCPHPVRPPAAPEAEQ